MLNNSTTAVGLTGPPHFVDLHVNPGESVSLQLFDGNETVLRGPATVTMISQHTYPPVPMPVQVPPGHMVQQIVDENGTLRHIILSAINSNETNTSNTTPPTATLVPRQQAYPYCCCCCYCSASGFFSRDLLSSSIPSPNPLPTPPAPPPPPPPIHSNLWEMGLTHVDSTRRLPFSRSNSKVNSCGLEVTFPPSTATIRRRLPNRNYSYSKRSPSTSLQVTTTTSTATINNNTSITTTTVTTTATGTLPTSNIHYNNSSDVNGVTSTSTSTSSTTTTTTTTTSTKVSSSSGVLSIAAVTSTLTTANTTSSAAAISTTLTSPINANNNSGSTSIRGINGKSQTLTVTVSETRSISQTGAITFPVTHLRTNGGNVTTSLTTSIPELITSTDQSTKHHHHSHQHQHHQHQSQSAKIEFLFNASVTSGTYNSYNNKHNSVVSNVSSSTSSHHYHHPYHHIVTHGGNGNSDKLIDNEKNKSSSHHNKDNLSSGVFVTRSNSNANSASTTTTTNGLLIGFSSSPVKNNSLSTGTKGSTIISSTKSIQSSNHSPKNDHLSRKVRREDKSGYNSKEEKESNKSKENTPQRKKSNNLINTTNGGNNYTLEGEIGRNSSDASSTSNSNESSPIKIPLNRLSRCKPTAQSPIPTIIPINVTLATGSSTATVPLISIPKEASSLSKKGCDLVVNREPTNDPVAIALGTSESTTLRSDTSCFVVAASSTSGVNSSLDLTKGRKDFEEPINLIDHDSKSLTNKSTGRNLNNRGQQQKSNSIGTLPTTVIVYDVVDNKDNNLTGDTSDLIAMESEMIQNISETRPNEMKSNVTKANQKPCEEHGDHFRGEDLELKEKNENDEMDIKREGKKQEPITENGHLQFDGDKCDENDAMKISDSVISDGLKDKFNDSKEMLKIKDETDGDKDVVSTTTTNSSNGLSDTMASKQKCKSGDKVDSVLRITSSLSSSSIICDRHVDSVTLVEMVDTKDNDESSARIRDANEKEEKDNDGDGGINVNDIEDDDDGEDEDEDEDDDSSLTGEVNKSDGLTNLMTTVNEDPSGDSKMKPKSSPQRSPKHLLPQIQVFCLTYTSLTATSVKLKWINEQGHHSNHHHIHHHAPSSSFGGSSLLSETRHYMVEMMKLNRSNAKNGTITPTTRIVYQGTQASCRVSHLTPSEQYSFRVRSSENNHQLVSNVLTLVTPEHQPVSKHRRSRAQNSNLQIQLSSESTQKHQHINQNQEQSAFRQQESVNDKNDGETKIIRSEQKCAIVIISLVSVLAVVLACIIHNLLMY